MFDIIVSPLHTEATSTTYTFTTTDDCIILGYGAYSTPTGAWIRVGTTTYTGENVWTAGGYYLNVMILKVPKGSTVTAYYTRYYILTE